MTMSKRHFVLCAASSFAAPMVRAADMSWGARSSLPELPELGPMPRMEVWQAYLLQSFEVQVDGAITTLVLHGVQQHLADPDLEQFVLGFLSPSGVHVPEGTHMIRHANGQG